MGVRRVLVVDDDPILREIIVAALQDPTTELTAVASGEEALAVLEAGPVDLVLLDVVMPGIGGLETCRRLKSDPRNTATPVILVTALDAADDVLRGFEAGAEEFVSKPFNRAELRARVRSMLRMKEHHDALAKANEDLRRAQQQREMLSSFLVHDLKTPLAVVVSNASFLLQPEVSGAVREAAQDILEAGQQMDRMVLDLLDVARSETQAMELRKAEASLPALLRKAIASVAALARSRRVTITLGGEVDGPALLDAGLVERVLMNLLDNALKYSPAKGTITLEVRRLADRLELRQEDEGPGVPAELREQIFEPYARIGAAHARTSRGLGLAFCRLAVAAHGGRIWVESAPTGGATFCVSIPQPPRAQPEAWSA